MGNNFSNPYLRQEERVSSMDQISLEVQRASSNNTQEISNSSNSITSNVTTSTLDSNSTPEPSSNSTPNSTSSNSNQNTTPPPSLLSLNFFARRFSLNSFLYSDDTPATREEDNWIFGGKQKLNCPLFFTIFFIFHFFQIKQGEQIIRIQLF